MGGGETGRRGERDGETQRDRRGEEKGRVKRESKTKTKMKVFRIQHRGLRQSLLGKRPGWRPLV